LRCSDCQHDNPNGAKSCSECGTRLPAACPRCGTALVGGANLCSECGVPVANAASAIPSTYELVGVYLSVMLVTTSARLSGWRADLFPNAVTASIGD
jgi:hypothetical protein